MKCKLLACTVLLLLAVTPAVVTAEGPTTLYADGTCAVGARPGADGTTAADAFCVGSPPDFSRPISDLPGQTGTIVYIFRGGWCKFPVENGDAGAPTDCSQGAPPATGAPLAPALLLGLAGMAGIALLVAGLLLRQRSFLRR
jgi:hypothetical protein